MYQIDPQADEYAARFIRFLIAALLALPLLCCSCATTAPREAHDVRAEQAHPNLATSNNPK